MKLRPLLASSASLVLAFAAPAHAGEASVPSAQEPSEEATSSEAPGVPALWKVADEDTTIYMFGTVHVLPPDVDWHTGAIKDALAKSGELVTEIDMTPEAMAEIAGSMQSKGMLPQGETLRGLMNEEQRATYEAGLAKLGIPANAFDRFEPWFAAIALLQISLQASGYTDDKGVENVLEATVADGTKRVALETVDFQINVFDGLPIDQQLLFLLEGAEDPLASIEMLNQVVELWSTGRAEELGALMTEAMMAHPNLAERLLYSRNANWAEWIDERLDEPGTVFLAVGAGHLSGEKSVPDLLAERGIETSRVQ
ncbi:TraB/GumN family protein [Erythrobacter sp. THAF29]|uniref:TraB/GumN family protein n=1 Tax=Erythrobacter sp. THAF29 TaxID=2587851 RepID=UPI0012698252|nr:TraB/GumN family protein [Erythrobacter sp. THAF29]QFT77839.1 TraB family protein [Erythrobacter sp. THAF29]